VSSHYSNTDSSVDIARRFAADVWNERGVERIPEFVGPEYVLWDPARSDPIRSPDELAEYVRALLDAFPDLTVEQHTAIATDTGVMTHYTTSGTHEGAFGPLPATGRRVAVEGTAVIRVEDGRFREERLFYDPRALKQQLGVTGVGLVRRLPAIAASTAGDRLSAARSRR